MARAAKPETPLETVPPTVRANVIYDPGPERLFLVVLAGPDAGAEMALSRPASILGRGPGASLNLTDAQVSRRHVKLVLMADKVRPTRRLVLLHDLGSTNGVQVDGRQTKRQLLRGGEKILVGRTVLRLERRDSFDSAFYSRLQQMATTDSLTGVGNRLALAQELERQEAERIRYGRPYAVVLVDLDLFKRINDRKSHAAGDQVLRDVASLILANLRDADRAFRYGGDEFVAILAETEAEQARVVAERIRSAVAAAAIRHAGDELHISVSAGVAEAGSDDVLARADRALYRAKRAGRNCVRVARGGPKRR